MISGTLHYEQFETYEIIIELGGYSHVRKSLVLNSTNQLTLEFVLESSIRELWRTTSGMSEKSAAQENRLISNGWILVHVTGKSLSFYEAENGGFLWRVEDPVTAGPVFAKSVVSWATKATVKSASPDSGSVIWEHSFDHHVVWLSAGQDLVFVLSADGTFSAISAENGTIAWEVEKTSTNTMPGFSGDTLCFLRNDGRIAAIDLPTGRILWKTKTNLLPSSLVVTGLGVYAFDRNRSSLSEYDLSSGTDGRELMRIEDFAPSGNSYLMYTRNLLIHGQVSTYLHTILIAADSDPLIPLLLQFGSSGLEELYLPSQVLYVASPGKLQAYDLQKGRATWTASLKRSDGYFFEECKNVVFFAFDRLIVAVDRKSGAPVWESEIDGDLVAMTVHQDSIFISSDHELIKLSLD